MPTSTLVVLPLFLIALAVTLALTPLYCGLSNRTMRDSTALVLIWSATVVGYLAGGALVWSLVPSQWHLSFWETVAASVDAEKYGHLIEHYAQGTVVMILCACMAGAVISGTLAGITARLLKRPRHA
jgi:hypothetical protein